MLNKSSQEISSVRDTILCDFETQLETTNFLDETDCDNSYQYMITQLDIYYRHKDENDNSLTIYDVSYIVTVLDDIEKYSLKQAYQEIINYLDK